MRAINWMFKAMKQPEKQSLKNQLIHETVATTERHAIFIIVSEHRLSWLIAYYSDGCVNRPKA
ncbi:MAG: hypothetical protein A2Z14_14945 [Chloroflexi bacterium RBG_16_48_8]|nr:MAG: hypothetical protein A2Z14_14945 [Chloroflexi bacterium RBG_16_48_8]